MCQVFGHGLRHVIAAAIENRTSEKVEREPEILAHHWAEAGNAQRAVGYWLEAGRRVKQWRI
jgi:predicted ATPase